MDKPIKTYIVIWNGHEFATKDCEKAIEKAKEFTYGENEYDIALILTRKEWFGEFPDVKISNVHSLHWIVDGIYELINLKI